MGGCLTRTKPVAPASADTSPQRVASPQRGALKATTPSAEFEVRNILEAIRAGDTNATSRFIVTDPACAVSTPLVLHVAAELGKPEIVGLLLAAGADCAAVDEDGQTPLHVAVAHRHAAAVERLTAMQPCAELHVTDNYKMSPLHLACEDGDVQIIALLLARGATQTPSSPMRPPRTWTLEGSERVSLADESPLPDTDDAANRGVGVSHASPLSARRKQLLQMQQQHGGSAVFIARSHSNFEAVALLERAASGEQIPMPVL